MNDRVVLVVDDDDLVRKVVRAVLEADDYEVLEAPNGQLALEMIAERKPQLVILDVMMPGIDGVDVCRQMSHEDARVLMLTARDAIEDRIAGLDGGADDYLVKPFAFGELLARLRALARRGPVARPAVLEVGSLRLDPATRRVWRGQAEIDLTQREFSLFEAFMRRPGEALSRFELLEAAWDGAYENRSKKRYDRPRCSNKNGSAA